MQSGTYEGLIEVECLDLTAYLWFWLANEAADADLCALTWQRSAPTWTEAAIEAFLGGNESRRQFLEKWERLYSGRSPEARQRAAGRAWLKKNTPRDWARKGKGKK